MNTTRSFLFSATSAIVVPSSMFCLRGISLDGATITVLALTCSSLATNHIEQGFPNPSAYLTRALPQSHNWRQQPVDAFWLILREGLGRILGRTSDPS